MTTVSNAYLRLLSKPSPVVQRMLALVHICASHFKHKHIVVDNFIKVEYYILLTKWDTSSSDTLRLPHQYFHQCTESDSYLATRDSQI